MTSHSRAQINQLLPYKNYFDYNYLMRSERSHHQLKNHQNRHKHSNSPTLASSYSDKAIIPKNFKNQPFPKELKKRLIGRKFKFEDFSDQEEDNSGIVVEEEEIEIHEKKKILPHFELMSDHGQFLATRSRIRSEHKGRGRSPRYKSVQSLKLPQVMQEKKEDDELKGLGKSKLSQFKDRNEFNQHSLRNSQSNSYTDHESLEPNHMTTALPELIIENEAEETKSQKLKRDKSLIASELEKIIVDELDEKRNKKQESQQCFESIIEEEKQEEEIQNIGKLRISLSKFEHQTEMFNKFKEEELISASALVEREHEDIQEREEVEGAVKQEMSKLSEEDSGEAEQDQ